jgi:hypothetical protein
MCSYTVAYEHMQAFPHFLSARLVFYVQASLYSFKNSLLHGSGLSLFLQVDTARDRRFRVFHPSRRRLLLSCPCPRRPPVCPTIKVVMSISSIHAQLSLQRESYHSDSLLLPRSAPNERVSNALSQEMQKRETEMGNRCVTYIVTLFSCSVCSNMRRSSSVTSSSSRAKLRSSSFDLARCAIEFSSRAISLNRA